MQRQAGIKKPTFKASFMLMCFLARIHAESVTSL